MWNDISLWFLFAFPWWLTTLSSFSYAYWLSTCALWKNVCSVFYPFFVCLNQVCECVCICVCIELYELFIYTEYQSLIGCIICRYFLPLSWLSFHVVDDFLLCAKAFSLIRSHLFSFVFYFIYFRRQIQKSCYCNVCKRVFCIWFSLGIL